MKNFLTALQLIWTAWSGSNLRRVAKERLAQELASRTAEEPAGLPYPPDPDDYTDPVPPVPAAPQIIIPKPEHEDRHGPASAIARAMLRQGMHVFESLDDTDWNLNTVAIRSAAPEFDRFTCRLAHFWKNASGWSLRQWPITTFPGAHYMIDKLLNPAGAAILCKGQYRSIYRLDRHRGIYEALCQRNGPVRVYRDGNRNRVYDMDPRTVQTGNFGINLHATQNPDGAPANHVATRIHTASAGCPVFARIGDFVDSREHWRNQRRIWGVNATVSLIDETDLDTSGIIDHSQDATPQIDDDPGAWHPGGSTVGIRNRNLLNVKQNPANPWRYSTGADSRGHTIFPSFPKGLRAGIITLRTYWTTHRLRTVADILARWAPSSDTIGSIPGAPPNSPAAYARFVSERMGVSPTSGLMLFRDNGEVRSAEQLFALVAAMATYENVASLVLPRSVFDEALKLID